MSYRPSPSAEAGGHIEVRRADQRFATSIDWLESRTCFSFGAHYDPANTHHGLLIANNEEIVAPVTGFDTHPHRDVEIVTWVLSGALVHQDSLGHSGAIYPGLAQRMSAGSGVLHSEKNDTTALGPNVDAPTEPVRFVQMWVIPDAPGGDPAYEQLEVGDALASGDLVAVVSGLPRHRDHSAIRIGNSDAAMHVTRMVPDRAVTLPEAPFLHVYVVDGAAELEGVGRVEAGDAVRLTDIGGLRLSTDATAEVLVWEMHSALRPPGR
ncbi:pirin family protein [Millisia brevis]|uniref:pirin family protein n=1 Tax=Millisia brevis TaxID=264148 RepID=UPI00082CE997|nr:pirin-like bicupin family protein [Millisia brevis]